MPEKKRFSKATFTQDIDKRIRQRSHSAQSQRRNSAIRQTNEGIVAELQHFRKRMIGSELKLDD